MSNPVNASDMSNPLYVCNIAACWDSWTGSEDSIHAVMDEHPVVCKFSHYLL